MDHYIQKLRTLDLLRQMIGTDKNFRPGQWEAIESIAIHKNRTLVVQRTGWGKSLVYFLATRLLRDTGVGPTLLISPLLSLMRNQIEMANKIGIRAVTINSANQTEWKEIESKLKLDTCDLILISPERLNNEYFLKQVLPLISGRIGLFVVDEAHCISDWGHDFRPDYQRIVRILQSLPKGISALGTTATANDRVISDIHTQLGPGLTILRGSLDRESLRLQNIILHKQSDRLAWLCENLPKFKGSGIIYCLTVADTERVAGWLKYNGFSVEAYHAGNDANIDRPALEQAFINNEIKVLVATVALGMGFDKPDIEFVVHFQAPGTVIHYYQQVGRAGRSVDKSYGILLSSAEDEEIHNYFIESAFPPIAVLEAIIRVLSNNSEMGITEILSKVNASMTNVKKALKLLELDGAVGRTSNSKRTQYFRTPNFWKPDVERYNRVRELRRKEQGEMLAYINHQGCLMEFLRRVLDDPYSTPCGRCANCRGKGFSSDVNQNHSNKAVSFLRETYTVITPRKRWPFGLFPKQKSSIPLELQNVLGRSLCLYGDSGWGELVRIGKYQTSCFSDQLVDAAAHLIKHLWLPDPSPAWVTTIPSTRHPNLVPDYARRLAAVLCLPYKPVFMRKGNPPEQKSMENSYMQAQNVQESLVIMETIPEKPVLLVDDIIDSGWTLTIAGYLLRTHGSGPVHPFTLAQATGKR